MSSENIFLAIRLGDNNKVLCAIGCVDINQLNDDGQNLLHEAISYGNELIAKELVERNIDVNQKDLHGQTPLHYAATYNQRSIAACVIEMGGDLGVNDMYGNQPLWTAVFNARGKHDVVKLFVDAGAVIDHKNHSGRSPLDFSRQIHDQYMIEILMNRGLREK